MIKGNTGVKFDLKPNVNHNFLYNNEEKQAAVELMGKNTQKKQNKKQ